MNRRVVKLFEGDAGVDYRALQDLVYDRLGGRFRLPSSPLGEEVARLHADGLIGRGWVVGLVDSGIDTSHPALVDAVLERRDFTAENSDGDPLGHGTLVALLIRYTLPGVKFADARVVDSAERGSEDGMAAGIRWLATLPVRVINMSSGVESPDPIPGFLRRFFEGRARTDKLVYRLRGHPFGPCVVCLAARETISAEMLLAAAVGNDKCCVSCPGRGSEAIVVGSVRGEVKARFSAFWPDFVIEEPPQIEGTSFTTPFMSALICLIDEEFERQRGVDLEWYPRSIPGRTADWLFRLKKFADSAFLDDAAISRDDHAASHAVATPNCEYCLAFVYPIRNRLGNSHLAIGDCDKAAEEFSTNVVLAPEFPAAHSNLGAAQMCRGDLAAARVEFEKAIELDPTFVPAWQGLAQASRLIGDKGAADQAEAKANALTAT